jgi:hypothetical protein
MSKWQPIETAPRDGTKLLLFRQTKNGGRCDTGYWHQPANPDYKGFWTASRVSHWMPLPEPPNAECATERDGKGKTG